MGTIEMIAQKKRVKAHIQQAILVAVALSGVVLIATIIPNLPAMLVRLPSIKRAQLRARYRTALGRLSAITYDRGK